LVDILFTDILKRFRKWLKKVPTGKFIIEINVGQGNIRGRPKITITEDI
jgi:hypothetical protein